MCQSKTKSTSRLIAATVAGAALSAMLGGCSDLYMDRRDEIHFSAGDAIAANNAMQTNDPWPAHSGNTNIAFNGQRMQTAVERYRTNTPWLPATPVINPSQPTTQTTPPTQQTLSVAPAAIRRPQCRASLRGRRLRRRQSCQSRTVQRHNLRQPIDASLRLAGLT
jgi:hypothetical protein